MKALAIGVALLALAPAAASARDHFAERLLLTKAPGDAAGDKAAPTLTPAEIAAAQRCLDEVRSGAQFPHKADWRALMPATAYPAGLSGAAEKTSDCLVSQGLDQVAVVPSMSIVTNHLLH